ncbi:MAG: undecaprenyl/decaprenyl-phosphate alpha-N-acetylglucosaminyl 1-phosphate transferase [Coriobacteriia bacterium]|nr:undecaprenyl/decaprenyl-phosphate alpha-N-acetylglucosaminyl 1-phosphate transferase [Coriobacteriia bacterium]
MSIRHYAFLALVAAVVTLLVTPLVRWLALKRGLVHYPGRRDVHTKPVPRLGGVAIFVGVLAAIAVQALGEIYLGWGGTITGGGTVQTKMVGVLLGFAVIFMVGLIDDLKSLSPGWKFLGTLVAATVLVVSGLKIEYIGNPFGGGLVALGILAVPITIVYVAAFSNIINLIDGLDGLAAGITAIAAMSLLVIAAQGNRLEAAAVAAAVIGASVAFLRYNFNPASIIMGDSGALFLGFALASISLMGVLKSTAAIALAVPLLIVGVPIFDTASAIVRRLVHRRPIHEADKGHIHHRLLGRGFNQRQTVLIIYVWSAALAVGGWAVRYATTSLKVAAVVALFGITGFMAYWLGLFEIAQHSDGDTRSDE